MNRQSRGHEFPPGEACLCGGLNLRTSELGEVRGIFQGPSCHRGGGFPVVNLSWVTQGRATPGTRAPHSQPSASSLQEIPPAPHPVPALPSVSAPRTTVSSPGSEQLWEAHPPTFLSWERGSKYLEVFSRAGTSGQLRVKQQPVQTPCLLERRKPRREEAQPSDCREDHPEAENKSVSHSVVSNSFDPMN